MMTLGTPLLVWGALGFLRIVFFIGQQRAADGWDEAREKDREQKLRCGRRFLRVLGVSLHTALRESDTTLDAQLEALLDSKVALKSQPSESHNTLRHSRLTQASGQAAEHMLSSLLSQILLDLAPRMTSFPVTQPLALFLTVESAVPEHLCLEIFARAWNDSGIRQATAPAQGNGLAVIDQWLDKSSDDDALLMVVAIQVGGLRPQQAETAVGLLIGNQMMQPIVPEPAYLHRPEQERRQDTEHLLHAARQSLDWVPMPADLIGPVWLSGISTQRDASVAAVLAALPASETTALEICNLDTSLGQSGPVSPWLAIAAAAQAAQRDDKPQFIFSGENSADAGLWSMVVAPAIPPLK
jgi:hypothetical protein